MHSKYDAIVKCTSLDQPTHMQVHRINKRLALSRGWVWVIGLYDRLSYYLLANVISVAPTLCGAYYIY